MLGAIIGDIVGSRFEFNNYKGKDFDLFTDDCFFTDDSVMTITVGKAIMETLKEEDYSVYSEKEFKGDLLDKLKVNTTKYMREIGRKYPHCGYGGKFYRWLGSNNMGPYNSLGNGAAMRVSAVGHIKRPEKEILAIARAVTEVTHDHPEGIKGAEATALAIHLAINGGSKEEIKKRIEHDYYKLGFTIDEIRETYRYDLTCHGTVPPAIAAFLESDSFEDAIRIAISLGGDSDTLAAITGSIAEAFYGVPRSESCLFKGTDDELWGKAVKYLDSYLIDLWESWYLFNRDYNSRDVKDEHKKEEL